MAGAKPFVGSVKPSVPPTRNALAITVLAGGPSNEREVSLESGKAVSKALESLGHQVYLEDISATNLAALARQVDVVFVALHGAFGEDGDVQTILERRKLRYTGSPPESCKLAMNKAASKARLMEAGLPTARYAVATNRTLRESLALWSMPVVVKPVREGSSIHCYIVREVESLRAAAERVLAAYGECLIEEFIPGLELTVGVLGDRALPPIEIRTPREFYDYEAKYKDDRTQYLFDIDLPSDVLAKIQEMSVAAHRALGCRDFSRVDWRVRASDRAAFILELNSVPGMTSHSLVPKAAARVGLAMPQLCEEIVQMAWKRRPESAE